MLLLSMLPENIASKPEKWERLILSKWMECLNMTIVKFQQLDWCEKMSMTKVMKMKLKMAEWTSLSTFKLKTNRNEGKLS